MPRPSRRQKKMGQMYGARLDVQVSRDVTPIAEAILEAEHGLEHNPGVRDDLCPLCKEYRRKHGRK